MSEDLPPNLPPPKSKPVVINGYYDASHASCLVARGSVTGILLYINNTLVDYYKTSLSSLLFVVMLSLTLLFEM